jgi:glycosyltransferase 2 family protein
LLIKALLAILLLLLVFTRVKPGAAFAAWRQLSLTGFLITGAFYCGAWAVASYKWKLLLPQHSWLELLKLNFIGQYYSTLFPGQIAGEIVKTYRIGRGRQDAEQIAASVIIDRITGLLGLLGVAIAGVIFSRSRLDRRVIWTLVLLATLLLLALSCLKLRWWSDLLRSFTNRSERFGAPVGRMMDAWRRYLDQPGLLFVSIVLGASFQFIAVLINIQFARELGIRVDVADWCWVFGVISVVTMLPFTVGGLGLREGSFVGSLALLGVAPEKAMALSFAIFGLLLAGAAVGGVLEFCRKGETARAAPAWTS